MVFTVRVNDPDHTEVLVVADKITVTDTGDAIFEDRTGFVQAFANGYWSHVSR